MRCIRASRRALPTRRLSRERDRRPLCRTRLDGDTLRIPASTAADHLSLLVVRRRLYDIDSGLESAGRGADVTVDLEITPRVALY